MASNIRMPHPKIISLYGIICSESIKRAIKALTLQIPEEFFFTSNDTSEYCYLIFENIIGTSLYQFPNKQPVYPIMLQLFTGLTHLHRLGIAHRDIKPDNVMIGPDGQLKIIDLGISCIKGTCLNNSFTPAYTMLKYMVASPQVKNNLAFNNDIYSSLILIYFLASNGSTKFTSSGGFLQDTNAEYNKIPEKYRKFLMGQIGLILSVVSPPLDAEGSIKKMQEILAGLNAIETSGGRKRFRKTKRRSKGSRKRRLLKHHLLKHHL
jgi:serine/threonine protein kinase